MPVTEIWLEPVVSAPVEMFSAPATVIAPVRVAVELTLMVRLLKFEAPICGADPVKVVVPVVVNVPDSTHVDAPVPVTVMVLPLSTIVPPVWFIWPIEIGVAAASVVVPLEE